MAPLPQRLAAEALGTAFLVSAVVGSGIMAQRSRAVMRRSRCSATRCRPAPSWSC
jgi:glycerol uptake facilitator-like aquaporin